jgi:uncharacterized membrane protein
MKLALSVAVGLLSVPTTMHVTKRARRPQGSEVMIDEPVFRRMHGFIVAEPAVFARFPLAATLMARGIGK